MPFAVSIVFFSGNCFIQFVPFSCTEHYFFAFYSKYSLNNCTIEAKMSEKQQNRTKQIIKAEKSRKVTKCRKE